MKIESLSQISPENITVKIRSYMRYMPKLGANYISRRTQSAFMYVINGEYEFYFDGGSVYPRSGDVIYLPEGAAYGYKLLSKSAECAQIEFVSFYEKEPFSFSTHPTVAPEKNVERAQNNILKIIGS